MVKNLPAVQETWVWSLGWENPLEKGMATHSSILAWRIPWTEEPGELQSTGSQRVRHHWGKLTRTQFTQTGVNQIKFSREMDINNLIKCCSLRGTQGGSKYGSMEFNGSNWTALVISHSASFLLYIDPVLMQISSFVTVSFFFPPPLPLLCSF